MNQEQQPRWRPTRRQLLWAGAAGALLTVAILIGYHYDITLWDWLKLLVVPAVIAAGGLWFNRQQRERELTIARQQREQELEIAERRTQDEALQAYLDQMSNMLIPNQGQPSLYKARPGDSLSSVARARTLSVLPRLDGTRKARVVQFLYEAGMIAKHHPILLLRGADLSGVNLVQADLREANLDGTNLNGANLRNANLNETNLNGANLRDADLSFAYLNGASLALAIPKGADVTETYLRNADLRTHFDGRIRAFSWTEEQLGAAKNLEGATMRFNGQKYEDWLKDKQSRGKDGEKSGPSQRRSEPTSGKPD